MKTTVSEISGNDIDIVHEKRHMDVFLETPPPPLETSRTFFSIYLDGFKIKCCVQNHKGTLGTKPGADNEHRNILKM